MLLLFIRCVVSIGWEIVFVINLFGCGLSALGSKVIRFKCCIVLFHLMMFEFHVNSYSEVSSSLFSDLTYLHKPYPAVSVTAFTRALMKRAGFIEVRHSSLLFYAHGGLQCSNGMRQRLDFIGKTASRDELLQGHTDIRPLH
jgi:hypothetical protein